MFLSKLEITHFRNLVSVQTELNPRINLLHGDNGSGKSSFLEAIHYLGLARSFRTTVQNRIIHNEKNSFSLFGRLEDQLQVIPIGISKEAQGKTEIRISGKTATSILDIASIMPLQFIDGEAHHLLAGGPKYRREFLDWGVFHVEHNFYPIWQRYQRALKQRNALLRSHFQMEQVSLWDQELASTAYELNKMRESYFQAFKPLFLTFLADFLPDVEISIAFYQGWPAGGNLLELLKKSLAKDVELGYTLYGPQKADVVFRIRKNPVQDALSQGQQKLVVYACRLAQGNLLEQQIQKKCLYLVDDLPSELDLKKRQWVAEKLFSMPTQIFVTGIDKDDLCSLFPKDSYHLFHVEHGKIH